MKNLLKLLGIMLVLVTCSMSTATANDVPADWSYIGQSMVWDEETDQYMVCTTYVSQSCMDQCNRSRDVCPLYMNPDGSQAFPSDYCDTKYDECRDGCLRQRCYLVI